MATMTEAKWRKFQRNTPMNSALDEAEYGYARECINSNRETTIDSIKPRYDELIDFLGK